MAGWCQAGYGQPPPAADAAAAGDQTVTAPPRPGARSHRARVPGRPAGRDAAELRSAPVVGASHRCDVRAGPDRSARNFGEALDELGHFPDGHVAVGIWAIVAMARKAALPVGGEQAQGVPAFAPPGVRHLAALEDDVVDRPVAEEVARGETRVPRADDDRGGALDDGPAPQATSTVTCVGFVRASNTAERFWDWATSASMSCFGEGCWCQLAGVAALLAGGPGNRPAARSARVTPSSTPRTLSSSVIHSSLSDRAAPR